MSRSLKKGPFVEAKLYSRIVAMNDAKEKKVLKEDVGRELPQFTLSLSATRLRFMTEKSMYRFTLPRIWLVINSVNSRPREFSADIPVRKPLIPRNDGRYDKWKLTLKQNMSESRPAR